MGAEAPFAFGTTSRHASRFATPSRFALASSAKNAGPTSARYPIVQLEFHGVRWLGPVPGWDCIHLSGMTNTVLRWMYAANTERVLHPNFPYEISPLDLRGHRFEPIHGELPNPIRVTVTLAADGFFRDGIEWFIRKNAPVFCGRILYG